MHDAYNRPLIAHRQCHGHSAPMKSNSVLGDHFIEFGKDLHVEANQSLLHAGDVARHIYLIKAGALRLCVCNALGVETSVQFFFEGDMVCSLESMVSGRPSGLDLVTIEACDLRVIDRDTVIVAIQTNPVLQSHLLSLTQQRLIEYVNLYTSAISETPTERYQAMLAVHKEQLARIPLHILAGYLGVSPVHLSRIRRKLKTSPSASRLNICK